MKPQSNLQKLKEKMKKAAGLKGLIIEISAWRFACPNHGKEKTFHSFETNPKTGKVDDIKCDCGSIFRKIN